MLNLVLQKWLVISTNKNSTRNTSRSPLIALLFLLTVEVLALKIKEDKEEGLKINLGKGNDKKEYLHIAQLADDTTLILKNENAVLNSIEKVKKLGKSLD